MKMKKQLAALFMSAVLAVASLSGCGSKAETADSTGGSTTGTSTASTASTSSGKQPYVIFVNPLVGNPVFTAEENGLKKAAEEFGFKLKVTGPSTINDIQMVQAVESAITEKPDFIVTVPYNYTALESTYKKAKEAGVPIINTSSESSDQSLRVAYIGTDNAAYGKMAADILGKANNGKGKVLSMMVRMDISNQKEIIEAFEKRCQEAYPDMKIVSKEQDNGDAMTSVQKFKDAFKAHPEIDTVLCVNATCGNSAALVTKELGIGDKVRILAIDDIDETIKNVKDGAIWGTMVQNFYKMGYMAGQYGIDFLNKKDVPSVTDSGTIFVNKDNVNTYKDEMLKVK
jgi:ribose transport system substrate-binding protein